MQKLIFLLTLLLSCSGFSQDLSLTSNQGQQIVRQKGRYFVNGQQISTRETRQLLASDPEALVLFKSGKRKESLGGFLIGFGGALVVADVVVGLVSDVQYPTAATYVGVGALAISIPVLSGKNKKIDAGLERYNQSQKKLGYNETDYKLSVIANQNGYGFQMQF